MRFCESCLKLSFSKLLDNTICYRLFVHCYLKRVKVGWDEGGASAVVSGSSGRGGGQSYG